MQIDQAIQQWTLAAISNKWASAMEVEVDTKMDPQNTHRVAQPEETSVAAIRERQRTPF
jgi:hypothetical protein